MTWKKTPKHWIVLAFVLCLVLGFAVQLVPKPNKTEEQSPTEEQAPFAAQSTGNGQAKQIDDWHDLPEAEQRTFREAYIRTEAVVGMDGRSYDLHVPSIRWEWDNGYPVNQSGESDGMNPGRPDNWLSPIAQEPDLLLVKSRGGTLGYVRFDDFFGGGSSVHGEEAASQAGVAETSKREIPMYLEDGATQIGYFQIG